MIAEWLEQAACRTADPDLFFPEDTPDPEAAEAEAKAYCLFCPVKARCAASAIKRGEEFGIFGGMTAAERKLLVETYKEIAA